MAVSMTLKDGKPAPMPEPSQPEIELVGSVVLDLKAGELTINEPTFNVLINCRLSAARWGAKNPEVAQDPTIKSWRYIAELTVACSSRWVPTGKDESDGISLSEFGNLGSRDFAKISTVIESYLVDEEEDEKKN